MIEGLGQVLFYLLVILAIATGVSYFWYRRSKEVDKKEDFNERTDYFEEDDRRKNPTLDSFDGEVEEIPRPIHEVEVPVTNTKSNPTEFDLKTELEKVFVKKVEKGEIELDLVPVTDARISKTNLIEILGISWMPKLKYSNPNSTEKVESVVEEITVPEEEVDVDAIPMGAVQEPEEQKTKKKRKIVEESVGTGEQ